MDYSQLASRRLGVFTLLPGKKRKKYEEAALLYEHAGLAYLQLHKQNKQKQVNELQQSTATATATATATSSSKQSTAASDDAPVVQLPLDDTDSDAAPDYASAAESFASAASLLHHKLLPLLTDQSAAKQHAAQGAVAAYLEATCAYVRADECELAYDVLVGCVQARRIVHQQFNASADTARSSQTDEAIDVHAPPMPQPAPLDSHLTHSSSSSSSSTSSATATPDRPPVALSGKGKTPFLSKMRALLSNDTPSHSKSNSVSHTHPPTSTQSRVSTVASVPEESSRQTDSGPSSGTSSLRHRTNDDEQVTLPMSLLRSLTFGAGSGSGSDVPLAKTHSPRHAHAASELPSLAAAAAAVPASKRLSVKHAQSDTSLLQGAALAQAAHDAMLQPVHVKAVPTSSEAIQFADGTGCDSHSLSLSRLAMYGCAPPVDALSALKQSPADSARRRHVDSVHTTIIVARLATLIGSALWSDLHYKSALECLELAQQHWTVLDQCTRSHSLTTGAVAGAGAVPYAPHVLLELKRERLECSQSLADHYVHYNGLQLEHAAGERQRQQTAALNALQQQHAQALHARSSGSSPANSTPSTPAATGTAPNPASYFAAYNQQRAAAASTATRPASSSTALPPQRQTDSRALARAAQIYEQTAQLLIASEMQEAQMMQLHRSSSSSTSTAAPDEDSDCRSMPPLDIHLVASDADTTSPQHMTLHHLVHSTPLPASACLLILRFCHRRAVDCLFLCGLCELHVLAISGAYPASVLATPTSVHRLMTLYPHHMHNKCDELLFLRQCHGLLHLSASAPVRLLDSSGAMLLSDAPEYAYKRMLLHIWGTDIVQEFAALLARFARKVAGLTHEQAQQHVHIQKQQQQAAAAAAAAADKESRDKLKAAANQPLNALFTPLATETSKELAVPIADGFLPRSSVSQRSSPTGPTASRSPSPASPAAASAIADVPVVMHSDDVFDAIQMQLLLNVKQAIRANIMQPPPNQNHAQHQQQRR